MIQLYSKKCLYWSDFDLFVYGLYQRYLITFLFDYNFIESCQYRRTVFDISTGRAATKEVCQGLLNFQENYENTKKAFAKE